MKLIPLLLFGFAMNSNVLAQDFKTIAEFPYDGSQSTLALSSQDFINEVSLGGTDITAADTQQQQQCQQQQQSQDGYEPQYIQTCENKTMIYRQTIILGAKGAFFPSKINEMQFNLDPKATQIIQQQQQQLQQQGSMPTSFYYQCQVRLVRYFDTLNPSWKNQQQAYFDHAIYESCLENGGDPATCKVASTRYVFEQQQQQPQQSSDDSWSIVGGSCKIVAVI